jgi:glycosyltransferase involved in cell wall biosynthesis
MPRVSVITPVYNGEKYLKIAIDSLLKQTFLDWELILVDDGSQDATPQIIDGYDDPRIIKMRQENAGEAMARNNGLDHAGGEYIAFLDADDLLMPEALSERVTYLASHPEYDVLISDGFFCDEEGVVLYRFSEIRTKVYTGKVLESLIVNPAVVYVPICTLARRSAIINSQARFDRNLVIGPDWDFWIQMAVNSEFGYLDKPTCLYRVHQTNITRTSGLKRRIDDQVYGRKKVMNAAWFEDLSLETKRQFFYNLLLDLLSGQPDRQQEIMESSAFLTLPVFEQAQFLRQVGIDVLQKTADLRKAKNYLEQSRQLGSSGLKTTTLLWSMKLGRHFALLLTTTWQALSRLSKWLRSVGKPRPRSVPPQLRPEKR